MLFWTEIDVINMNRNNIKRQNSISVYVQLIEYTLVGMDFNNFN